MVRVRRGKGLPGGWLGAAHASLCRFPLAHAVYGLPAGRSAAAGSRRAPPPPALSHSLHRDRRVHALPQHPYTLSTFPELHMFSHTCFLLRLFLLPSTCSVLQAAYYGASPTGDVASAAGHRQVAGGWKLATAAVWFALGLACVVLAAVEHERSRAASTGTSVLCGSVLSCDDGLDRTALLSSGGRVKTQSLEEEGGDGSAKPETMEEAIDGFDLFSFGGEAPDSKEPVTYFNRFKRPGDEPGDDPHPLSPNAMEEEFVGDDVYRPFSEHSQFLQPGDVPYDEPAVHHSSGFYNFFGLLNDQNEDMLTGETTDQACCVCIPGAPDYREGSSGGSVNPMGNLAGAVAHGLSHGLSEAEADIEGAAGPCPLLIPSCVLCPFCV